MPYSNQLYNTDPYGGLANYGGPMSGFRPAMDSSFGGLAQQAQGAAARSGGGGFFAGIGDFFKGGIGTSEKPSWGGMALGTMQGLGNAFMGMKQYGLAKKTLKENKRQFELNYNAQKKTTNASLEDRQHARVASNAGGYESVGSYMNKYKV